MVRRKFLALSQNLLANAISTAKPVKKILLTGGAYGPVWMKYLIALTGKEKPKICFMPTASGDNEAYIKYWMDSAKKLSIDPYVQRVFIESSSQKQSFDEVLLGMDAILAPEAIRSI
jgi:dipeptidase E